MPFSNISSFITNRFSTKESLPINSISVGKIEIDSDWIVKKVHGPSAAVLLGSSGLVGENLRASRHAKLRTVRDVNLDRTAYYAMQLCLNDTPRSATQNHVLQ